MRLSTTDIWCLAARLARQDNTFRDKVAVLVLPGLNLNKAELFEMGSKTRGFNVEVFTNYEDTIQRFYEDAPPIMFPIKEGSPLN